MPKPNQRSRDNDAAWAAVREREAWDRFLAADFRLPNYLSDDSDYDDCGPDFDLNDVSAFDRED